MVMCKADQQIVQVCLGEIMFNNESGGKFFVCNSAAQPLSLTGTTTYTGLVLYNRVGSAFTMVLKAAIFSPTIAETGVGAVALFSQDIAASLPSLTTTNV